jgi:pimeloyl-ACP methyl ester carboxylesterase
VRERACQFGSHGGLVGILCEPDSVAPGAPAVVLANVGLNHRVGPSRSWVECARALARDGFPSLRFDLSGLGDSEPRSDTLSDTERAARDLEQALDFLCERDVARRFVLVGNCSGVDSLHTVAGRDPRVEGAVYIDGYAYRNAAFLWRWMLLRWFEPNRWLRYARFRGRYKSPAGTADRPVWKREIPTREEFQRDLEALVARGVRLLFVFTGGMGLHYNHASQFYDCFGHRGTVAVSYHPRADHLLTSASERADVIGRICDFMRRAFHAGEAGLCEAAAAQRESTR